jgi:hypothetical protein
VTSQNRKLKAAAVYEPPLSIRLGTMKFAFEEIKLTGFLSNRDLIQLVNRFNLAVRAYFAAEPGCAFFCVFRQVVRPGLDHACEER